jgi:serine/threonine protein phosphatase PrpC
MLQLKQVYSFSSPGPYLPVNHDRAHVDKSGHFANLIDGVTSGSGALVSDLLLEDFKKYFLSGEVDKDKTLDYFYQASFSIAGNVLINFLYRQHKMILDLNGSLKNSQKSAASSLVSCREKNTLHLVNVGSNAAFLFRDGELTPIVRAQTFSPFSRVGHGLPLNLLGLFEKFHFHYDQIFLESNDIVMLCTNGIHQFLSLNELKHILERNYQQMHKIEGDVEESLFKKNSTDNLGAVFFKF